LPTPKTKSVLSILAGRVSFPFKRRRRRLRRDFVIVDFRDQYIKLPDGRVIPKERILTIDTDRKVIVYLDENYMVREARYAEPTGRPSEKTAAKPTESQRKYQTKPEVETGGEELYALEQMFETEEWQG